MFPSKSQIRARELKLQLAQLDTRLARRNLRRSARNAMVSPQGLFMGFTLGMSVGRKLGGSTTKRPGIIHRLSSLTTFLPLLRFF